MKETDFKGLFRHHGAREQSVLFACLDERTPEQEREALLLPDSRNQFLRNTNSPESEPIERERQWR